ncbi:NAD(P)/FAD-dependent oxidoreductase [Zavarzinia sp. CC-PAN008]|uniref:NAD(P)/FAD-dependent oxidoreductase n=1 Tax=Zavarzinia sp. CC-PAN008 TaxID=3243332 RepID=UPI003F749823
MARRPGKVHHPGRTDHAQGNRIAMADLYDPSIYDAGQAVPSYWEATAGPPVDEATPLAGDATCDVAVIGGGYTGLSCALHLARDHGIDVAVLEAGPIGWGASGRNGGFCVRGSTKLGWDAIIAKFGLDEARRFSDAQTESVALVRTLGEQEGIDFDATEAGEWEIAHRPSRMTGLAAEREALARDFGLGSTLVDRAGFVTRAYRGPEAHGGLLYPDGFGLHPLKYVKGLARAALRHGARVHGRSRVLRWDKVGTLHHLATAGGTLKARRVVMATAGFTPEALHPAFEAVLLPVLTNIIVTRPLTQAELDAHAFRSRQVMFDTRNLLFYFRLLPDNRFLFGSRGGLSAAPSAAQRKQGWMTRRLYQQFPAWKGVEITHFWRGLTDLSYDLLPHMGRLAEDSSVSYALAYHGNGVAMATWCGRHLAQDIAGRNDPSGGFGPAPMSQPLKRFPAAALRGVYLAAAYAGYTVKDAL